MEGGTWEGCISIALNILRTPNADLDFHLGAFLFNLVFNSFAQKTSARDDCCIRGFSLAGPNRYCNLQQHCQLSYPYPGLMFHMSILMIMIPITFFCGWNHQWPPISIGVPVSVASSSSTRRWFGSFWSASDWSNHRTCCWCRLETLRDIGSAEFLGTDVSGWWSKKDTHMGPQNTVNSASQAISDPRNHHISSYIIIISSLYHKSYILCAQWFGIRRQQVGKIAPWWAWIGCGARSSEGTPPELPEIAWGATLWELESTKIPVVIDFYQGVFPVQKAMNRGVNFKIFTQLKWWVGFSQRHHQSPVLAAAQDGVLLCMEVAFLRGCAKRIHSYHKVPLVFALPNNFRCDAIWVLS